MNEEKRKGEVGGVEVEGVVSLGTRELVTYAQAGLRTTTLVSVGRQPVSRDEGRGSLPSLPELVRKPARQGRRRASSNRATR